MTLRLGGGAEAMATPAVDGHSDGKAKPSSRSPAARYRMEFLPHAASARRRPKSRRWRGHPRAPFSLWDAYISAPASSRAASQASIPRLTGKPQ